MSIEAMKQALEALQGGTGNTRSWHLAMEAAIAALRTALQQAEAKQPATPEPVAFAAFAPNGNIKAWTSLPDDVKRLAAQTGFDLTPLYTHPAPGVPDDVVRDAQRYRWLRKSLPAGQGSLTVLLDDRCNGAFHKAVFMESLDASIDAAMLAAAQAQKGGA